MFSYGLESWCLRASLYSTLIPWLFREFADKQLELGILDVLYNAGVWERRGEAESRGVFLSTWADGPATVPSWAADLRLESQNQRLPWLKHYFRRPLYSRSLYQDKHAAPIRGRPTLRCFSLEVELIVVGRAQLSTRSVL